MLRTIAGAVAGFVTWWVLVIVIDFGLRLGWPEYASVEKAMTFSAPMMFARLAMSGIASIGSGAAAAVVGRDRLKPTLISGLILLLLFTPIHYSLWTKFPVWYHATFLTSLVVLSVFGGSLARVRRVSAQTA
ncbi:MAG TPA: hypothetical protein VL286_07145 [Rhizomicrobium sp.]|jgi:predicted secreted protein|nr:hypothetical protein [Rhizomicrobium sp.]